jgi:hypothetical protein
MFKNFFYSFLSKYWAKNPHPKQLKRPRRFPDRVAVLLANFLQMVKIATRDSLGAAFQN